jgi:hypothetical protein
MAEVEGLHDGKPEHHGRMRHRPARSHRLEKIEPDPDLVREREVEGLREKERRVLCYAAVFDTHGRLPARIVDALAEGQRLVDGGWVEKGHERLVDPAPPCVKCERQPMTRDSADQLCSRCRAGKAKYLREKAAKEAKRLTCAVCEQVCKSEEFASEFWTKFRGGRRLCLGCSNKKRQENAA